MDTDTKGMQGHGMCGDCGMHHGMCGHGHWRHILIKILVALFIFWAGVQFGELKAMVRGGYAPQYGYGMMSGWSQSAGQY